MKEEKLRKKRGIDTYPALLLSSSQPLDWSGLCWALLSHWGRATQNHMPKEGKERKSVEGKVDAGGKEKEIRRERKVNREEES